MHHHKIFSIFFVSLWFAVTLVAQKKQEKVLILSQRSNDSIEADAIGYRNHLETLLNTNFVQATVLHQEIDFGKNKEIEQIVSSSKDQNITTIVIDPCNRIKSNEFGNLKESIQELQKAGSTLFYMTSVPSRTGNPSGSIDTSCNDLMREIAGTKKITLIDVLMQVKKYINTEGLSADILFSDEEHLNDTGNRFIAHLVREKVATVRHLRQNDFSNIPQVDLDAHIAWQTVVDKESSQYLGHPTTVLLDDDKTLFIVYPKGHGRGGIVMKKSVDAGKTWSERLPVPENWSTSQEVPTIYKTIDAVGKKRLIMFSGLYPIKLAHSEDDGETWSSLEKIGDFGGIVAMASMVQLNDGAYMALFHDDGRFISGSNKVAKDQFWLYKTLSFDGGLTWSAPEVILTHETAHLCEPGAIRSPDGRQILLLLRENSRRHNSFMTLSNDEGKTWSIPVELPASLTGDRHVAQYSPDGRLFISFRDTGPNSPTQGDWVGWIGTYEDIIAGKEGQYRVRLKDNKHRWDTAYPGVEILPDGTIVTTTYGHWEEGEEPYILSVRFKLTDLDALLDTQ